MPLTAKHFSDKSNHTVTSKRSDLSFRHAYAGSRYGEGIRERRNQTHCRSTGPHERFPEGNFGHMSGLGLFEISVPLDFGGSGFEMLNDAVVMEEQSRGCASVADQCGLADMICTLLVRHGTEEQCSRYLSDLMTAKL